MLYKYNIQNYFHFYRIVNAVLKCSLYIILIQMAENNARVLKFQWFWRKPIIFSSSWTFLWNYMQDICLNSFTHIPVIVFLTSNDQYVFWLFNFEPWLAVTSILLPCDVDFCTKRFSRRNSPPPGSRPPHSGFCLSPFQSQTSKVLKNNVILIWAHNSITENRYNRPIITLCIDSTYAHLTLKSLQTLTIITVSLNIWDSLAVWVCNQPAVSTFAPGGWVHWSNLLALNWSNSRRGSKGV
jgi:hypothetical protein